MVSHLEIFAEEPSLEVALRSLVPILAPDLSFSIYPSTGKQTLLGILPARLKGYSSWLPADWRILIAVDRDDQDCKALKQQLDEMAKAAGLVTRSEAASQGNPYAVVNRVIVEELEAWFFGDWEAVRGAYPRVNAQVPAKANFRNPDQIPGGTWEALERVLQQAGYFGGGLRKIEFAQTVTPLMDPQRNLSKSFQVFADAVRECAT
jgi:Domain of unknown function (DUF4276)